MYDSNKTFLYRLLWMNIFLNLSVAFNQIEKISMEWLLVLS